MLAGCSAFPGAGLGGSPHGPVHPTPAMVWEPLLLGCQLHVQRVAQPCTVLWWGRQERVPASLSPGQPEDWGEAGGCLAPATRLMEGLWAESGWGSAPHLTLFWLLGD